MANPVRLYDLEKRVWCEYQSDDAVIVQTRFPGRFSKTEPAPEPKAAVTASSPATTAPAAPVQTTRSYQAASLEKARAARAAKRTATNGAHTAQE